MLVAYITSMTLLPALLTVLNPPGEPEPLGFSSLAPVDRFMERHRIAIIVGIGAGRRSADCRCSTSSSSISTRSICAARRSSRSRPILDLRRDPMTGANAIERAGARSRGADADRERLREAAGGVAGRHARRFRPRRSGRKLAAIQGGARQARTCVRSEPRRPPRPTRRMSPRSTQAAES